MTTIPYLVPNESTTALDVLLEVGNLNFRSAYNEPSINGEEKMWKQLADSIAKDTWNSADDALYSRQRKKQLAMGVAGSKLQGLLLQ